MLFPYSLFSAYPRYVPIYFVNPSGQRSAAVTAAATIALVGSFCALMVWGWFSYAVYHWIESVHAHARSLPTSGVLFVAATAIAPPALVLLGLQTGVGLFRLNAWPRKSALFWAGISLAFCIYLLVTNPYEILVLDSEHWSSDLALLKQFLAQALLIVLAPVSIWWLILFTRRSVKDQFAPRHEESQPPE